jgi:hypothetical protein
MKNETDWAWSPSELCDHHPQADCGEPDGRHQTGPRAVESVRREHPLCHVHATPRRAAGRTPLPSPEHNDQSLDPGRGVFFNPHMNTETDVSLRRNTMEHDKDSDPFHGGEATDAFHDNDKGDVWDLYNACNGETVDGLLDKRKLDELSGEEAEVLDVARLREVWAHTATRCPICADIVHTLNLTRRILRDERAPLPESGRGR